MATKSEPQSGEAEHADAPAPATTGTYHFLDVGGAKYGECVLVEFGSRRILIDGSHPQDFRGQPGFKSIPQQLADLLDEEAPHDIDLAVVTHCHADHVGCLPELLDNGTIQPRFAYLTHPKLGFGRAASEDVADSSDPALRRLEAALREENVNDLNDAELAAFIDAVERVEPRYARFVDTLQKSGAEVHMHLGGPLPAAISKWLAPTGITLIGPSEEQLLFCAEQIARTNQEARDAVAASGASDNSDVLALYRDLVEPADRDSGYTRGNGMNCQSIVLAFGPPGERVLLAGDMQFTEPGVRGALAEVAKLRDAVVREGPFAVFKTTHHTSHNGQDDALLDSLGSPRIIVHCGGVRDESHPYPSLLHVLENRDGITFARTDRNGLITIRPGAAPDREVEVSRGKLNDFTANVIADEGQPVGARLQTELGVPSSPPTHPAVAHGSGAGAPQIVIVNLPPGPVDMTVAGVEIIVRDPGRSAGGGTGGTHEGKRRQSPQEQRLVHDETQDLRGLLFVTDVDRLRVNVGRAEADQAIAQISARGGELLSGRGDNLSDKVVSELKARPEGRGVVLLGGYDVVQPHRVDSLDPELRRKLRRRVSDDDDQFWVWSDAAYADLDDDGLAERPVSRIPDARDPRLLRAAFSAKRPSAGRRFGIRNVARPFADTVWRGFAGAGELFVSEPFKSSDVEREHLVADRHYLMLHGQLESGTEFTGEDGNGYPVAFEAGQVPPSFDGVVFSGCCWGALTVEGSALLHPSRLPPLRRVDQSIALSYLRAGARAFIGCTGSHYSGPSTDPDENYAMRLHEAFWDHLEGSQSPAEALHEAKLEYAKAIVQADRLDPLHTARRMKNLAQFTCLGLGW